jgi:hypothetical protein
MLVILLGRHRTGVLFVLNMNINGWNIRQGGPGWYAVDPGDICSLWIEGNELHYESLQRGYEFDIPFAVIDKLRDLTNADTNSLDTVG